MAYDNEELPTRDQPAFATPDTFGNGEMYLGGLGLTKREWYAGQALTGMLAQGGYGNSETLAVRAFEMADAMVYASEHVE